MTSSNGRREADLAQHDAHTWKAVQWLRENKDKFHGKVFEPVRLQVQVARRYRQFVDIAEGPITMGAMNVSPHERAGPIFHD